MGPPRLATAERAARRAGQPVSTPSEADSGSVSVPPSTRKTQSRASSPSTPLFSEVEAERRVEIQRRRGDIGRLAVRREALLEEIHRETARREVIEEQLQEAQQEQERLRRRLSGLHHAAEELKGDRNAVEARALPGGDIHQRMLDLARERDALQKRMEHALREREKMKDDREARRAEHQSEASIQGLAWNQKEKRLLQREAAVLQALDKHRRLLVEGYERTKHVEEQRETNQMMRQSLRLAKSGELNRALREAQKVATRRDRSLRAQVSVAERDLATKRRELEVVGEERDILEVEVGKFRQHIAELRDTFRELQREQRELRETRVAEALRRSA